MISADGRLRKTDRGPDRRFRRKWLRDHRKHGIDGLVMCHNDGGGSPRAARCTGMGAMVKLLSRPSKKIVRFTNGIAILSPARRFALFGLKNGIHVPGIAFTGMMAFGQEWNNFFQTGSRRVHLVRLPRWFIAEGTPGKSGRILVTSARPRHVLFDLPVETIGTRSGDSKAA